MTRKPDNGRYLPNGPRRQSIPVGMVQRSIPHYRVPLFEKLASESEFHWTFYCGRHDEVKNTGLEGSLVGLETKPIAQRTLWRNFVYQSGIPVNSSVHQALILDYGWTIVSNPLLFARARSAGIATIGWSKGISQRPDQPKSFMRRQYERASMSLCDTLVVYGQMSRDYFIDLGFDPTRIFVAQNTVDTRTIASRREVADREARALAWQLGMDPNRPVVGFLGKISSEKGVDSIVGAFERVRLAGHDAQLLIAGKGPAVPQIEGMIAGSVYRRDIYRLQEVPPGAEAAVFRMMDIYASFAQAGLGVLEALASGVAIVATPEHFPETELLHSGETAFLSSESTIEAFSFALGQALADVHLRHSIAQRGEAVVLARATLESMSGEIRSAVRAALKRRTIERS